MAVILEVDRLERTFLGVGTTMLIGLFIWLVDAALICLGVKKFHRSTLIAGL